MFALNRPSEKPRRLDGVVFRPFFNHNYQYAAPAGIVNVEAHQRVFSKNWTLKDPNYVEGIMYVLLDWWILVFALYAQGWKVGLMLLLACVAFSEIYNVYDSLG